jgi:hypothetical protein
MARGWESKSIEAQQEEAAGGTGRAGRPATPQERARQQQRRTLELARARSVADLERATTEAHRAMLRRAIADIDERLGRI